VQRPRTLAGREWQPDVTMRGSALDGQREQPPMPPQHPDSGYFSRTRLKCVSIEPAAASFQRFIWSLVFIF